MKYDNKLVDPGFIEVKYDDRDIENAGKFRGVGDAAKVGRERCTSYDPMPDKPVCGKVKRDHEG